ncbi:hypothetical protein SARC_06147 [Sphaeroforma arctica JP610]|uniref:Uncharacterized protein n=1 Tax=Sphaeroforma arctica JP610 TaxID=667725 RepID=A0A0L0FXH2_9EUKA|nr:hypothetical protein SARC_06147 [Sphaeroforma arctica JP610]KNC81540.1 hypothetical protein SARC_06147 [Sphaeroforma arctica JP610]|eukprot:XP_014155442.1 hypothetical protein SARC_06147 [Sphaeroforma arctica JP610]
MLKHLVRQVVDNDEDDDGDDEEVEGEEEEEEEEHINDSDAVQSECECELWGPWSSCALTSETGCTQARMCQKTTASSDGSATLGCPQPTETAVCYTGTCAPGCFCSDWQAAAPCSVTCGEGVQVYRRGCTTSSGQCETEVTRKCSTLDCPIVAPVCQCDEWGPISECAVPAECGNGTATRQRTCTNSNNTTLVDSPESCTTLEVSNCTLPCDEPSTATTQPDEPSTGIDTVDIFNIITANSSNLGPNPDATPSVPTVQIEADANTTTVSASNTPSFWDVNKTYILAGSAALLVLLIIITSICCCRRKKKTTTNEQASTDPTTVSTNSKQTLRSAESIPLSARVRQWRSSLSRSFNAHLSLGNNTAKPSSRLMSETFDWRDARGVDLETPTVV